MAHHHSSLPRRTSTCCSSAGLPFLCGHSRKRRTHIRVACVEHCRVNIGLSVWMTEALSAVRWPPIMEVTNLFAPFSGARLFSCGREEWMKGLRFLSLAEPLYRYDILAKKGKPVSCTTLDHRLDNGRYRQNNYFLELLA